MNLDLVPLSEKILKTIADGNIRLRTIAGVLNKNDRLVDRELQKMRRRKQLAYTAKDGWSIVQMEKMHRGDVWPLTKEAVGNIDPGVRGLVQWLIKARFHTTDSGDGVTKLDKYGGDMGGEILDVPHVFMVIDNHGAALAEADRLKAKLTRFGVTVAPGMISVSYDPADESCILSLYNVNDKTMAAAHAARKKNP